MWLLKETSWSGSSVYKNRFNRTRVNSGFSRTRVNSNLTFNGERIYLCILKLFNTCACHKLLKQHISSKPNSSEYCIARGKDEQ